MKADPRTGNHLCSTDSSARVDTIGSGMVIFARIGQIGRAKDAFVSNMNETFGLDNWAIAYRLQGSLISREQALVLYEESYFQFLQNQPELLDRLLSTALDVYDNEKVDVQSGLDYQCQLNRTTHLQDIAIRRCVSRLGRQFSGKRLVKVKSDGRFPELSPGKVPFVDPTALTFSEHGRLFWKKWLEPGSVEDFWQNQKVLLARQSSQIIENATRKLEAIFQRQPPDAQDRFSARRIGQYLAMVGSLTPDLLDGLKSYLTHIQWLETLNPWLFNVLEILTDCSNARQPTEEELQLSEMLGRFASQLEQHREVLIEETIRRQQVLPQSFVSQVLA